MIRPQAMAALVALTVAAMLTGCFGQNVAEGRYVEASASGRLQEFQDPDRPPGLPVDTIHLFRLNIVSFDEEAGGVVELFEERSYESFEREPSIVTESSPGYSCTRIEQATTRDDRLDFRFLDRLNRLWQVTGDVVEGGDLIEARLERLAADGRVVELTGSNLRYLWPEDQLYFIEGNSQGGQLVLERSEEDVGDDALECVDYQLRDELVLVLPSDLPLPTVDEGNLRLALVLTRADTQPDPQAPLAGLRTRREVLTATLDMEVDVLDGERRVVVRSPPPELSLVDIGAGIAVGTFVVYLDRPDDEGQTNDRWDNLLNLSDAGEPVLAYLPNQVVVFNLDDATVAQTAKDAAGQRVGDPLFDGERRPGWSLYDFFALGEASGIELPGGEQVVLVRQLLTPGGVATLERPVAEGAQPSTQLFGGCGLCYPSPQPGSDGQPPDCTGCPPILPLLFL